MNNKGQIVKPYRVPTSSSLDQGCLHTEPNLAVLEYMLPTHSTPTTVELDYSVHRAHPTSDVYMWRTSSQLDSSDHCVNTKLLCVDGNDRHGASLQSPFSNVELCHLIVSGRPTLLNPSSFDNAVGYMVSQEQKIKIQKQAFPDVDYIIYPMRNLSLSLQDYSDVKVTTSLFQFSPCFSSASATRTTMTVHRPSPFVWKDRFPDCEQDSCSTERPPALAPLIQPQQVELAGNIFSVSANQKPLQGAHSHDDLLGCPFPTAVYNWSVPTTRSFAYSCKRVPPPSSPPSYEEQIPAFSTTSENFTSLPSSDSEVEIEPGVLNIQALRKKCKKLDLPLISALCNDRLLLEQTNAFIMPRHNRRRQKIQATRPRKEETVAQSKTATYVSVVCGGNNSSNTKLTTRKVCALRYHSGSELLTTQNSKQQQRSSARLHLRSQPETSAVSNPVAVKKRDSSTGLTVAGKNVIEF